MGVRRDRGRCFGAGCNNLPYLPYTTFQPYALGPYRPYPYVAYGLSYAYGLGNLPTYYGGYVPLLWRK